MYFPISPILGKNNAKSIAGRKKLSMDMKVYA